LSQSGNRRFWPLATGDIDIEGLKRDRLQLLGEAAHYEAKGESLLLGLWDEVTVAQDARRAVDPWEEALRDIPTRVDFVGKICHRVDDRINVATADLLGSVLGIDKKDQTTLHSMRLANVMKNLGWNRHDHGKVTVNGKQVRGYWREG
jgi:predicted P-loop ATPase